MQCYHKWNFISTGTTSRTIGALLQPPWTQALAAAQHPAGRRRTLLQPPPKSLKESPRESRKWSPFPPPRWSAFASPLAVVAGRLLSLCFRRQECRKSRAAVAHSKTATEVGFRVLPVNAAVFPSGRRPIKNGPAHTDRIAGTAPSRSRLLERARLAVLRFPEWRTRSPGSNTTTRLYLVLSPLTPISPSSPCSRRPPPGILTGPARSSRDVQSRTGR